MPPHDRRHEVPGLLDAFGSAPEAAVSLHTDDEVFTAEIARIRTRKSAERSRHAQAVTELHALFFRQVLLENEVFRDVPSPDRAGQDHLSFELVGVFLAKFTDRLQ